MQVTRIKPDLGLIDLLENRLMIEYSFKGEEKRYCFLNLLPPLIPHIYDAQKHQGCVEVKRKRKSSKRLTGFILNLFVLLLYLQLHFH